MNLASSLIFGSEGSYNILGNRVLFSEENFIDENPQDLEGAGFITKILTKCHESKILRWMTLGYTHLFIHEMGHALTFKLLTRDTFEPPIIQIFKRSCTGRFDYSIDIDSDWKETIVDVAGPMADVAFCSCKLIAATALKNHLPWPVSLTLAGGALLWISGELLYAYTSASNKDDGDFGQIASRSKTHLALATTALVSQCALGIFAAIMMLA